MLIGLNAAIDREARQIAVADRLAFLRQLDEDVLERAGALDLPTQTILRIMAEQDEKALDSILPAFIAEGPARLAVWRTALDICYSEQYSTFAPDEPGIATVRAGHAYQTKGDILCQRFRELLRSPEVSNDGGVLAFATSLGFAAFSSTSSTTDLDVNSQIVDGSRYSSVGGMMYYGFNISGKGSFLQRHSIEVLSRTFGAIADLRRPRSGSNFQETMLYREVVAHAHATQASPERVFSDTVAFLDRHERGHALNHSSNAELRKVLDDTGTERSAFYAIDFPKAEDLAAWPRICAGCGSARDVLFLLGDLLANMAILHDKEEGDFLHLLRAFNFWLVKKPSPIGRPRGIAEFLAHSYRPCLDRFYSEVGKLLNLANRQSPMLQAELVRFEREGWDRMLDVLSSGDDHAFCKTTV